MTTAAAPLRSTPMHGFYLTRGHRQEDTTTAGRDRGTAGSDALQQDADAVGQASRDSAERIKALMFTFEDLIKLDSASLQTLLRQVDKDKLGVALKGASESLRSTVFSNMAERAAKILREDMEGLGPVRLRDVDDAQVYMVNLAKELAGKGEIMIADNKGEDELVY